MRNGESTMKGDERILGQGDFVETVFKAPQENLDRKSMIRAPGYDFDWLVDRALKEAVKRVLSRSHSINAITANLTFP